MRSEVVVGLVPALLLVGCGSEPGESGTNVEVVEAGEDGCENGGIRVSDGNEERLVCNNESTNATGSDGSGDNGSDGTDGSQGEKGEKGDPGEPLRTDCEWCAAGTADSCSPDGITLQTCVDDGDGCGHWEAVETCSIACAADYRNNGTPDALGNLGPVEYRCYEAGDCSMWRPCSSGACIEGQCETTIPANDCNYSASAVCPAGEVCGSGETGCVDSDEWLIATATLYTAFDGKTHNFTAMGELLSASGCSATLGNTYWNSVATYCSAASISPRDWTDSSQGAGYEGTFIYPYGSLDLLSVTGTGTQEVPCGLLLYTQANRFQSTNQVCSVTLTHFDPGAGGYFEGTFTATADVRGHDEVSYDSSLSMSGSFRLLAK